MFASRRYLGKKISMNNNTNQQIVVCALYKFVNLPDYKSLKNPLLDKMLTNNVKGTLILATEGINGTISGTRQEIDKLLQYLNNDQRIRGIIVKKSYTGNNPFCRTKVKLKKEIVTMGIEGIDPKNIVGTYVKPADWNNLIEREDVILIDTRNDYECQVGTFKGAINPHTRSFRELPDFIKKNLDPNKHKKIAMFCTGGIRCEKSTAYLKGLGYNEVYHLEGGILKYLEEIPEQNSTWQGECFVFDDRISVNHKLEKGSYDICHACGNPITELDKQRPEYEPYVSCHHCIDKLSATQKNNFRERKQQADLAKLHADHQNESNVAKEY